MDGTRARAFHGNPRLKSAVIRTMSSLVSSGRLEPKTLGSGDAGAAIAWLCEAADFLTWGETGFVRFGKLLGLPVWLAMLYDHVYESLPEDEANRWAVDFMSAIPVGADARALKDPLYRALLYDAEIGVRDVCLDHPAALSAIDSLRDRIPECPDGDDDAIPRWVAEVNQPIYAIIESHTARFEALMGLYCAQRITIGHPVLATYNAVCARVGRLSDSDVRRRRQEYGYDGLTGAWSILGGSVGYAVAAEREARYRSVAAFLVSQAKALPATAQDLGGGLDPTPLEQVLSGPHPRLRPATEASTVPAPLPASAIPSLRSMRLRQMIARMTGAVIVATGAAILATMAAAFFGAIPLKPAELLDWLPNRPWIWFRRELSLGAFFGLMVAGSAAYLCGCFLLRGDGWYTATKNPGSFVLVLRSFDDDLRPRHPWYRRWWPRPTYEDQLVRALRLIGPAIAINDPHRRRRGGGRITSPGGDWQATVVHLMTHARAVVFVAGFGRGLRDEMSWARQLLPPERVLVHVPHPRWQEHVRYEQDGELRRFSTFLGELLGNVLSSMRGAEGLNTHFLWFRPGWVIRPLHTVYDPEDGPALGILGPYVTWRRIDQYVEELRPVRRALVN